VRGGQSKSQLINSQPAPPSWPADDSANGDASDRLSASQVTTFNLLVIVLRSFRVKVTQCIYSAYGLLFDAFNTEVSKWRHVSVICSQIMYKRESVCVRVCSRNRRVPLLLYHPSKCCLAPMWLVAIILYSVLVHETVLMCCHFVVSCGIVTWWLGDKMKLRAF
jgi:hypothetical protein